MNKLLIRYHSLLVLLLCTFSVGSSLAVNNDASNSTSTYKESIFEDAITDFDHIFQKENRHSEHKPSSEVKVEKNDEENTDSEPTNSSPLTKFNNNVYKSVFLPKELQKVLWHPSPCIWNLHADRCIFYQVFRI